MSIKTYSELRRFQEFEDRFEYLKLNGAVGAATFGFDRYINQQFYRSTQWKRLRLDIIARDEGCDLGVDGYEIYDKIVIHHINPMTADNIENGDDNVMNPDFLISTTLRTHNAIHYGDARLLARPFVERKRGDTKLW